MYRKGNSASGEIAYSPATAATSPKNRMGTRPAWSGCLSAPKYMAALESTIKHHDQDQVYQEQVRGVPRGEPLVGAAGGGGDAGFAGWESLSA